jgi:hypothetical protein
MSNPGRDNPVLLHKMQLLVPEAASEEANGADDEHQHPEWCGSCPLHTSTGKHGLHNPF